MSINSDVLTVGYMTILWQTFDTFLYFLKQFGQCWSEKV